MKLERILELYTPDNTQLRKYLSGDEIEIDPYYVWDDHTTIVNPSVPEWLEDNHPDVLKKLMTQYNARGRDALPADAWWDLPDAIQKEYASEYGEDFANYMMQHFPEENSSKQHFMGAEMLKRQTWLVHFTGDAYSIASDGFEYGVDHMDKLGLTTFFGKESKKYGGYNFAFEAGSKYARNSAQSGKYGKEAVMFTNSGVKSWHHGDEEDQVIFWGKDVDPRGIILIEKDYDNWCVKEHPTKRRYERDCVYAHEDFETVTNWIEKNWRQYSKIITGW